MSEGELSSNGEDLTNSDFDIETPNPQIVGRRDLLKNASFVTIGAVGGYFGHLVPVKRNPDSTDKKEVVQGSVYREEFDQMAHAVYKRHWEQTHETVDGLMKKYAKPTIGKFHVADLIPKLAECIDPTDLGLYCTNQLIHVYQVLDALENNGITDKDMYIAALVHDLGKVLLLEGEDPENVVCVNKPIGEYPRGIGLDNVIFQWNHDEYIYMRMKDHLPDHVGWLIRYHSISVSDSIPLFDERDKTYYKKYLKDFIEYDRRSKSLYRYPKKTVNDYRDLLSEYFPKPIAF